MAAHAGYNALVKTTLTYIGVVTELNNSRKFMEYFQLYRPEPPRLHADDMTNPFTIVSRCRVAGHLSVRRLDNPTLAVKNTKRDQFMIWLHTGPVVVIHSELVAAFERHGLTGYRSRSATVHFRDGTVSKDYSQLIRQALVCRWRRGEHP